MYIIWQRFIFFWQLSLLLRILVYFVLLALKHDIKIRGYIEINVLYLYIYSMNIFYVHVIYFIIYIIYHLNITSYIHICTYRRWWKKCRNSNIIKDRIKKTLIGRKRFYDILMGFFTAIQFSNFFSFPFSFFIFTSFLFLLFIF